MAIPMVTVNGKKITLPKPKIKLWRELIKFNEDEESGQMTDMEVFDATIDLVVLAFNDSAVTRDVVESTMDIEDLTACFEYITKQVMAIAASKAAQVPNARGPAKA